MIINIRNALSARLFNGNTLKFIAAFAMLVDHIGVLFFPGNSLLRIIGRLSMPIFAFMIAEGCRYTRNRVRYFLTIFALAAVCQLVYFVAAGDTYMSILVTFSFSILTIYALQFFKYTLITRKPYFVVASALILFCAVVGCVYLLNLALTIDYGFFGCMLPVFGSLLMPVRECEDGMPKVLNDPFIHVVVFTVGLVLLASDLGSTQWYSLMAVPLLLLYSGKRGTLNTKYFFYIFYPVHLAVLQGIYWIL